MKTPATRKSIWRAADWTARNFLRRVEVCFPVEDAELRERVDQALDIYWRDNVKAREQTAERTYVRRAIEGERVDAQALFREQARQRKKPNIDVRSLVIKTKTNSGKAMQKEQKVGQPA